MAKEKSGKITYTYEDAPDDMSIPERIRYAEERGGTYDVKTGKVKVPHVEFKPDNQVPEQTEKEGIDASKYERPQGPTRPTARGMELLGEMRTDEGIGQSRGSVLTTPDDRSSDEIIEGEEAADRDELVQRLMTKNAWPRDYAEKVADEEMARKKKSLLTR